MIDADVDEIGIDVAAIVEARGSAVTNVDIGDRVIFVSPGSFTTTRNVSASHCVKLDSSIKFEEGAAIPCVYITAMMALVDKGNLKKDQVSYSPSSCGGGQAYFKFDASLLTQKQTVLIHSACGGVGLAAIQIAQSLGAQVCSQSHT